MSWTEQAYQILHFHSWLRPVEKQLECKFAYFSRFETASWTSKTDCQTSKGLSPQICSGRRKFITVIIVNISLPLGALFCWKLSLRLCVTELLCLIKMKAESMCERWELKQQKAPLRKRHQSALYTHSYRSLQLNEKFKLLDIRWDHL